MLNRVILIIALILCGGFAYLVSAQYHPLPIQEGLNQKILGKWVAEDDSDILMVYHSDGKLLSYYKGVFHRERKWEFTDVCDRANVRDLQEWEYGILKITAIDDESDYMCYVVQGLESVLTLLRIPEGNLLIYDRVVE
jgi:hypothetical protein